MYLIINIMSPTRINKLRKYYATIDEIVSCDDTWEIKHEMIFDSIYRKIVAMTDDTIDYDDPKTSYEKTVKTFHESFKKWMGDRKNSMDIIMNNLEQIY